MDVDGISVEAAEAIKNGSVVSGYIAVTGHLILVQHGGTEIDAGVVSHLVLTSVFTADGIWYKTSNPGVTRVKFEIWGGGGGGGGGTATECGGGGGGGGFYEITILASDMPNSVNVFVGAGGAAGAPGAAGGVGGSSYVTNASTGRSWGAGGGGGGLHSAVAGQFSCGSGGGTKSNGTPAPGATPAGPNSTAASTGWLIYDGGQGNIFSSGAQAQGGAAMYGGGGGGGGVDGIASGSSVYGGGGGGNGNSSTGTNSRLAGKSIRGGNGGAGGAGVAAGSPGSIPAGGGGGGAKAAVAGGAGARGEVRITAYYD